MKAVIRITPSSYEVGDIVALVEDDHVFGGKDIVAGQREAVDIGNLSESDKSKLLMADKGTVNISAVSKLPTFQNIATSRDALKILHRRKYHFDGGVKLKVNAQER